MPGRFIPFTVMTAFVGIASVAVAQSPSHGTIQTFVADLRSAVARDDRDAVAAMIEYPITVMISGVRIAVRDRADFVKHYDSLMTADVKAAIASNSGVAVGGSVIRIKQVGEAFRIVGIVPPPPRRRAGGSRGEAERVLFRAGERVTQLSGTLPPSERDSYVIFAKQGQLLEVKVLEVRGRDIIAHVFNAGTNAPVDARARQGARTVTHRVASSGDYRIDVVRQAGSGDATLPYVLSVGLR